MSVPALSANVCASDPIAPGMGRISLCQSRDLAYCPPMIRGRVASLLLFVLLASPARAEEAGDIHAVYEAYAAGLHVANVEVGFGFGPWSYQVRLAYHTVGLAGFLWEGHQFNTVTGSWTDQHSAPHQYSGEGIWRGLHRSTLIDYRQGQPRIRTLVPPNEADREPVPSDLQANTVDTLSALAELMRHVAATGTCDGTVHTYDGRRATEAASHTAGIETVEATDRSVFSGKALRCNFEEHVLAGFIVGEDEMQRRPLNGSAWLARVVPGAMPLPVRLTMETRWFGDATLYLTEAGPGQLPVPRLPSPEPPAAELRLPQAPTPSGN
jgi:Protein of unknown function (DUF3108)